MSASENQKSSDGKPIVRYHIYLHNYSQVMYYLTSNVDDHAKLHLHVLRLSKETLSLLPYLASICTGSKYIYREAYARAGYR